MTEAAATTRSVVMNARCRTRRKESGVPSLKAR